MITNSLAACSPTCTLGGTIVINNSPPAPGTIVSEDVTAAGFSPSVGPFTQNFGILAVGGLTRLTIDDSAGGILALLFSTATAGSLVGYTGGQLDTLTQVSGLPPLLFGS